MKRKKYICKHCGIPIVAIGRNGIKNPKEVKDTAVWKCEKCGMFTTVQSGLPLISYEEEKDD